MAGFRAKHWIENEEEIKDAWNKALELMGYDTTREYQDDLYSKYSFVNTSSKTSPAQVSRAFWDNRRKEISRIGALLDDAEFRGITKEELIKLTKYFWVLVDSEKHFLQYTIAYTDLGIAEILDKYN